MSNTESISPSLLPQSEWPWERPIASALYNDHNYYPKISVITPSFNQGKFIETTIRSVLLQDYPNMEYIIIDGGSTDHTVDIIKKYEKWITYWVSEPDRGQTHALNKGFSRTTGDIIAWINSDDYYTPGTLLKIGKLFLNPETSIINGNCEMIFSDSDQHILDKSGVVTLERLLKYWKSKFCPPQPAIFFRKEVLATVGLPSENLTYAMDLELWIKMSLTYKFTYVDSLFAYYLVHEHSKTGTTGGFRKFIPEWKAVSSRYIKYLTFNQLILYYQDYFLYKYSLLLKKIGKIRKILL